MAIGLSFLLKAIGKNIPTKKTTVFGSRKRSFFKVFIDFIMLNRWSTLIGLFLLFVAGAYQIGWASKSFIAVNTYLDKRAVEAGIVLKEISNNGLKETLREDVLKAINLHDEIPLFRINISKLREKIEFLPWVKTAFIFRQFPDTLIVDMVERMPYALWQYEGNIWLIDQEGVEITQNNLSRYEELPFVVGKGAPQEVGNLMTILATEPDLFLRVKTAIRVGSRRWDIEFDTGARLRLPTDGKDYNTETAWHKFSGLDRDHRLLGRDVSTYDMRLSDRMTVQLTEEGEKANIRQGAPT